MFTNLCEMFSRSVEGKSRTRRAKHWDLIKFLSNKAQSIVQQYYSGSSPVIFTAFLSKDEWYIDSSEIFQHSFSTWILPALAAHEASIHCGCATSPPGQQEGQEQYLTGPEDISFYAAPTQRASWSKCLSYPAFDGAVFHNVAVTFSVISFQDI